MGFFDAIKKSFSSGGIKVDVFTPESFTWSDGSIPVTVHLTGHKTEPRTVTKLRFTIQEDRKDDGSSNSGVTTLNFTHSEPVELQPLQQVTVEVQFPIELAATETKEAGRIGSLMKSIGTVSQNALWYLVKVHTSVEDAGAEKIASYRIRSNGLGTSSSI